MRLAEPCQATVKPGDYSEDHFASVFVFNPFAEGYIAQGKSFAPVKHQALLAADLANLPQFLCEPDDIVLLANRPSARHLDALKQAGLPLPKFVELNAGCIDPASNLCHQKLRSLRPWAWGPDSVELLKPLFAQLADGARSADWYFNDDIARLYSKAWSAGFLRKILPCCHRCVEALAPGAVAEAPACSRTLLAQAWLCSEHEIGVAINTVEDAFLAIAAIRGRGHHRVVVKEAYGLAGHNAIRLWEPVVTPAQRRWLAHALRDGRQLVVEPWLERVLDFSIQLEMGPRNLKLYGYTGLVNDRKGQFLANWAEADPRQCLPAKVAALFAPVTDISRRFERLFGEIISSLEAELQHLGFVGPVSIDAFVYRTSRGDCRLKPVVEINPRFTMGRLALELMKHAVPGSCGLLRLVRLGQVRAEGFPDLPAYASSLGERLPLRLSSEGKIRQGALCLNDPARAQVCLATFEVTAT
jgi:hypothetical protein